MVRHVEEKKQMKQAAEAGSGKPQKKKEADSRQQVAGSRQQVAGSRQQAAGQSASSEENK